jgi:hypothetical protein
MIDMSDQHITPQQVRQAYDAIKYPGDLVAEIAFHKPRHSKRKWPRRLAFAAMFGVVMFIGLAVLSKPHQHPFNISRQMNISLRDSMSLPTRMPSLSMPSIPSGMSLSPNLPRHLPMVGKLPSTLNDASNSQNNSGNQKESAI